MTAALVRRWSRGAVSCLAVGALLGVSLLPAGLAASRAGWPDAPSTVEALVAAAHAAGATDADRGALLAAEAYRLDPSARTHAALLSVLDATAQLDREVVLADDVTALTSVGASAGGAGAVLAATSGGDVVRWDLAGRPEPVGSVGGRVTELVASTTGATVAALDAAGSVTVLAGGTMDTPFTSALDIAVSPSGELLAALVEDDDGRRLEVQDLGARTTVAELDLDEAYDSVDLGDGFVVLSGQDSRLRDQGRWERRSLPGLELVNRGSVLPDTSYDSGLAAAPAVSTYGDWAASVHPTLITLEDTSDGERFPRPGTGPTPTLDVRTAVVSPGGTRILVVRDQKNYVFDVGTEEGGFWELQGAVAADAAAFVDENRVVTAQGGTLTLWDTSVWFPRSTARQTELSALDEQALAPGGRYLVASGDQPGDDSVNLAVTYDLEAPGADDIPARVGAAADRHGAEDTWLPAVTDDGTTLVVETADGTVREAGATASPDEMSAAFDELARAEFDETFAAPVRYETGLRDLLAARISSGGELVLAAADGSVRVVDPGTGHLLRQASLPGGPWTSAELALDGRRAAFSAGATVAVVDTTTAQSAVQLLEIAIEPGSAGSDSDDADFDGSDADSSDTPSSDPVLAFGEDELVVAHRDGVVVLEADGAAVRAVADVPVPAGLRTAVVLPGTGLAVLAGDSPLAVLVDVATGEQVGELGTQVSRPSLAAWTDRLLTIGTDAGNSQLVDRDTSAQGLLATACAVAGRDLTAEEWSQAVDAPPPPDLSCERAS
ncbi:hypothetical protein ACFT2C_06400 [Promicromonospora sp. NPDC057138]|uniref:hypothetical protein n=1 Tax=Promicromonospora sp. NPDC057138 TaxID=3346031 RepID=UPI00363E494D